MIAPLQKIGERIRGVSAGRMGRCWAFAEVDRETRFDVFGEGDPRTVRRNVGKEDVDGCSVLFQHFLISYFGFLDFGSLICYSWMGLEAQGPVLKGCG